MLAAASDKTSGQSLTDIQIVAQTYTFMLAGACVHYRTGSMGALLRVPSSH